MQNKTYVINFKGKNDRWERINNHLKEFNINPNKLEVVDIDDLTAEDIKNNTTKTCYYFCSPDFIARWITHSNLWEQIAKEGDNVLVLEDNVKLVKGFNQKVQDYLNKNKNWDIIYLGCDYQCKFLDSMHAYLISVEGAKKLSTMNISQTPFNTNDIEYQLRVHQIMPAVVNLDMDPIKFSNESVHPFFNKMFYKLGFQNIKLKNINSDVLYIRRFDIEITNLSLYLILCSLLVGFCGQKVSNCFILLLLVIYMFELIIWNNTNDYRKVKIMLFELVPIILAICLGRCINSMTIGRLFKKKVYKV